MDIEVLCPYPSLFDPTVLKPRGHEVKFVQAEGLGVEKYMSPHSSVTVLQPPAISVLKGGGGKSALLKILDTARERAKKLILVLMPPVLKNGSPFELVTTLNDVIKEYGKRHGLTVIKKNWKPKAVSTGHAWIYAKPPVAHKKRLSTIILHEVIRVIKKGGTKTVVRPEYFTMTPPPTAPCSPKNDSLTELLEDMPVFEAPSGDFDSYFMELWNRN